MPHKKYIWFIFPFLASFVLLGFVPAKKQARGLVFEDKNRNGKFDPGEPGIPDVLVSNQRDVVKTDKSGRYNLSVGDETVIFITKPAGYQVRLNKNNLPQFYYIHQPNGSPQGLKFPGIQPTGDLPKSIDFSLIKTEIKTNFKAIISGDPQPRDATEVGYFRDDVVAQMLGTDAGFYMALGDIAYNDLGIYDQYNRAVAQIGVPAYNVYGNHDMNFRAPDDRHAAETFKRVFGPPYYSFEYGRVHFVILDDIDYHGWDDLNNDKGDYRGFLDDKQLQWLRNDLSHVPPDRLVVLAMHIPIYTRFGQRDNLIIVNRENLFDILQERRNLLAVSAHMHFIEQVDFTPQLGWDGKSALRGVNVGAACGAWWSGAPDDRGIPETYCMDGSPNGFFEFTFDGSDYDYRFFPANRSPDFQMRISDPVGVLHPDSLRSQRIVANVFAADPASEVTFTIDDSMKSPMSFTPMADPFMVRYFQKYQEYYPDWITGVPDAFHIWTASLPEVLSSGTHTISVTAKDSAGHTYSGSRIFEVGK